METGIWGIFILRLGLGEWIDSLKLKKINQDNKEIWCVVGNVKKEIPYGPGGQEIKSGLKKFKAGAKVHIIDAYYGMAENIIVIGQHRNSGKYISCTIRANNVENLRVKKIYSKRILDLLDDGVNHNAGRCGFPTKERAEGFLSYISKW